MSAKIVPLRGLKRNLEPPPLKALVARIHELAKDTANIGIPAQHFQERLRQRGKTMRDVLETVRKGEGVSGPTLDAYGDWRIKLRRSIWGDGSKLLLLCAKKVFRSSQ